MTNYREIRISFLLPLPRAAKIISNIMLKSIWVVNEPTERVPLRNNSLCAADDTGHKLLPVAAQIDEGEMEIERKRDNKDKTIQ